MTLSIMNVVKSRICVTIKHIACENCYIILLDLISTSLIFPEVIYKRRTHYFVIL